MLQDMSEEEQLFRSEMAYEANDDESVLAIKQELARRGWVIDHETGTPAALI
jgi:hypothetical protein